MKAGFFLDIAANTGDGFAYVILPAKDHADILTAVVQLHWYEA